MTLVNVVLERPIRRFVERKSQEFHVSPQETVAELVALGFETHLKNLYQRYRLGEISFGWLAQELGVTTWELEHLLEERDWPAYNLPSTS